jgi:hypothetical protein
LNRSSSVASRCVEGSGGVTTPGLLSAGDWTVEQIHQWIAPSVDTGKIRLERDVMLPVDLGPEKQPGSLEEPDKFWDAERLEDPGEFLPLLSGGKPIYFDYRAIEFLGRQV